MFLLLNCVFLLLQKEPLLLCWRTYLVSKLSKILDWISNKIKKIGNQILNHSLEKFFKISFQFISWYQNSIFKKPARRTRVCAGLFKSTYDQRIIKRKNKETSYQENSYINIQSILSLQIRELNFILSQKVEGIGTIPPFSRQRETGDRVTHSRWSSCDYLLSIGGLTTNHRWGNRLPGRRNGTQSSNDFSRASTRAFQRGTSSPRDAN